MSSNLAELNFSIGQREPTLFNPPTDRSLQWTERKSSKTWNSLEIQSFFNDNTSIFFDRVEFFLLIIISNEYR